MNLLISNVCIISDHQKYLVWFLDVQWERNKRTRVKLAAEDAFRDFIEFKSILIALYSLVWIWGISRSYTLVAYVHPDWFVKSTFVPLSYYYNNGKLIKNI